MMRTIIYYLFFFLSISFHTVAQQTEDSMVTRTRFLLYVPKEKPAGGKYPLLLFLHGSGERGNDLSMVKKHGPPSFLNDSANFPFIVVSPQCPEGKDWDTQDLLSLLDYIEKKLPVDKSREYVTGLSMGGFGTWSLALADPYRFAAIAPICGGGDSSRVCAIRNIPAWVFHGAKDDAVPYAEDERMVKGLQSLGSEVKFTLYPDLGHNCWTVTYQNPELYKWLLSHKLNKSISIERNKLKEYTGTYRYSPNESIDIFIKDDKLYTRSSKSQNTLILNAFAEDKFRIPGEFSGDGEVYFNRDKSGHVSGLTIGPCDHTYCAKETR